MIRRAVLVAAAAAALTLSPTVAMAAGTPAYRAPAYGCTTSDSSPNSGVGFFLNCVGAGEDEYVTMSYPGHPSRTVRANHDGEVSFPLDLFGGDYEFTFTGANGRVLDRQAIKVIGVSAPAPVPAPAPADDVDNGTVGGADNGTGGGTDNGTAGGTDNGPAGGTSGVDRLADTGLTGVNLAIGGGALVLVGAGAVAVTRRRKSELSA